MSATEILDTGVEMARIKVIRALEPYILEVTWAEGGRAGMTDRVDLAPAVLSYKIYRPLRNDPELFRTARLEEDGDVVAWDGVDLEMTADLVETLADQIMTPKGFRQFLERNNLTQDAAGAILGRSRRQIGYYLTIGPIPRVIALACYGYEARLRGRAAA